MASWVCGTKNRWGKERLEDSTIFLLIIAHPDDESMFFSPFLLACIHSFDSVYILCLSTGNYGGLGNVRKLELFESVTSLGVSRSHVEIIDHECLQDGMNNIWSPELIGKFIADYARASKANVLVTFDGYGVSGHPNHIACYKGALAAVRTLNSNKNSLASHIRMLTLTSVNMFRKFIGIFDIIPSAMSSSSIALNINIFRVIHAMSLHKSQFVWFRKLFVFFSRYSFLNSFEEINSTKFDQESYRT